jgi:hypothetical protein
LGSSVSDWCCNLFVGFEIPGKKRAVTVNFSLYLF